MDVAVIDWKDSKFEKDILYEDISAPQWIDFSIDDPPVDDEAWFCTPECNHPKTVEDFFKRKSPGSSKLQKSTSAFEIPQLSDRNRRDAALKKRGYPLKDSKTSKQVQDSENQNPNYNYSTPPANKSKSVKEMIKSSSEKNHGDNMLSPTEATARLRLLKSTLSAHNLFAGREILNQVTEFCNELKRLATRTKEKEGMVAAYQQEMGNLMESKSERKPLVEVKKEKFEEIVKQSNVKEKITTGKQTNGGPENSPIALNMKNIRGKDEERVLQIRTNPPSPQCFSANHGITKTTPSKAFCLRPQERGVLQKIESKEVKKEVKGSNTTIQNEAKGLDVFWFLKPCTLSS